MKKFPAILVMLLAMCAASWADYDVNTPHVIINQIYGASGGNVSHSFIELYNPTSETVNLEGWAVHYRSSPADTASSDKWYMTELSGSIPSHHSYLILGAENSGYSGENTITEYDKLLRGGGVIYTKGVSVILTSSNQEIPSDSEIFDNSTKTPKISGYVDMLSTAGNDYGKDGYDNQAPIAYETAFSALQSKKKGVRRIRFQDTDNNADDAEAADFSANDVSAIFPRSLASGEWGDELTSMLGEIEAVKKTLPKFYGTYCTAETAASLDAALSAIDTAVNDDADVETLTGLKTQLEEAAEGLKFKHDSKIAQVYVATKKNESGDSYGTTLTKAIGYVPAQMVVVGTDGKVMAQDLSWGGQIKVRGNSTSGGAKRPYNMKFSDKVNLFKLGKSKKWVLLADYYDPTLMRNKICLDVAEELGLEATPGHERVEVWVDGNYRGMYLLTEKIEEDKNRVNINVENGDFLIETESTSRQEAGDVYFSSSSGRFFRLREPEDETQVDAIKAKVDAFEAVLKSGTWEQISEIIDLDSFVSYYVLNEFMKTIDFAGLSVFFYCKDGKFYGGPAWDFDRSSGNGYNSYGTLRLSPEGIYAGVCHYYTYLFKFPEFQLAISQKLADILGTIEALYEDGGAIDSEADFYSDAIAREHTVWPVTLSRGMRAQESTYEGNTAFLKSWLSTRYDWMTDYFLARTYISSETFPDSALREYVKTFDTNSDSFLSTAEKSAVTSINLSGHSLTSLNLAGLEVFTQLVSLDVTNTGLTWLNIAKFPKLNVVYDEGLTLIDALPRFSGHSLVLSDQIGVDFYVEIPDGTDTRGAYAEFTVNGKTGNPAMLSNAEYQGGNEYMFTCYINSIQMAENITATFHYGSDESITEEYRANDYLDAVLDGEGYSDELVNLVKAIKDFGHYVQPPLAHNNSWEIGTDYAEMDCADPEIEADSADVKGKLSDFAIVDESKGSGIRLVEMDLELNSETTINVYLNVSADYSGNVGAYLGDSGENMAVKQNDGTYRITISGISAHMLGDAYTIHVDAGGKFDIEVSALSYANAVMNSKRAEDELKKAVIALYKYYDATMEYRKSKPEEYGNN